MIRIQSLLLGGILACGLLTTAPASAQMTAADSAAVLLSVAQQLRAEGRISLATALLDIVRQRYPGTPAAAEAEQLRMGLRGVVEERSGRTEVLVWGTIYGMALGALTPAAFGSESPEVIGVGLVSGGPLGFLLGRSILQGRSFNEGQARAFSWGTIWGGWQGFGWAEVADLGEEEFCDPGGGCFDTGGGGEEKLRAAIAGSLVGMGVGLILARKEIPAGTATTVSLGSLWGSWYGIGLYLLTAGDGGDGDAGLTATLLGGNAGLIATAIGASKWKLSRGRARLISIAGVAGLVGGFGILLIAQPDDIGNEAILVPLATSTLGLALGAAWTRNYDERAPGPDDPDLGSAIQWRNGKLRFALPAAALGWERRSARALAPMLRIPVFSAVFN